MGDWITDTVINLQARGILRVEDGNHGEYRPRPDEFVEHGVAFIRAADMADGMVLFDAASKVNDAARKRITKGIGRPGDILISHKGTVGRIARAPANAPDFVCSPQTTFWRSTNEEILSQDFLYVYMRSPKFTQDFLVTSGETDMAGYVSLTSQRRLLLSIPPIELQRQISSLISPLDGKIELNRRMNEALEALARAIHKDWFVDFGPTRTKMAMRGEDPQKEHVARAPYLSPDLWALFPDRLDADGKPEGWIEKPLDEIANFLNGLALQKFPQKGDDFLPVIKISQLRSGSVEGADRAATDIPQDYIVHNGDVVFSWSGSLMQRVWTNGRGALNQHLFKVTSEKYPKWFYYYWVDHFMPKFQAIAASKATTMGHIQRGHLKQALTTIPDKPVLDAANELIAPLFNRMIGNELESQTLAQIRDLLLPKLMSGEIRVKDAEAIVGEQF